MSLDEAIREAEAKHCNVFTSFPISFDRTKIPPGRLHPAFLNSIKPELPPEYLFRTDWEIKRD